VCRSLLQILKSQNIDRFAHVHDSVLQCVAVCCSVLQCVAVCCSVLQNVAVQCASVCRSVLQCVAVCYRVSHINHGKADVRY